jgi:hypothetical protein
MCCVLLLSACSLAAQNNSSTTPVPQFVDVAPQVGLTLSHLASKEHDRVLGLVPPERRETLMARPDPANDILWNLDVHLQGDQGTVFFDV